MVAYAPTRQYHVLIHLARVYETRSVYADDPTDLDTAITHGRRALELCNAEHADCPTVSVFYAGMLDAHAGRSSDIEARRAAENMCRHAISLCAPGHPLRATACCTLSWIVHQYLGMTSIVEAIKLQRQALAEIVPSQAHDKHRHLRYLGTYLLRSYEFSGNRGDLDESVGVLKEALRLCPANHVERYKATDRPHGQPRLNLLTTMGNLLTFRHQLTLSEKDIKESVEFQRTSLQRSPPHAEVYWIYLDNLSIALRLQFACTGELSDLEESLQLCRQAVDALSEDNTRWFSPARNLAATLILRFHEAGDLSDLNEALYWDRRALAAISPSHTERGDVTMKVISHLCTRYEVLGNLEDLEEAISLAEALVGIIPSDHSFDRAEAKFYLSKALILRGKDRHDVSDLNRAIQYLSLVIAEYRHTHHVEDASYASDIIIDLLHTVNPGRRERYHCLIAAAKLSLHHDTPYRDPVLALNYLTEALADDHRDVRSRIRDGTDILRIIQQCHRDMFAEEQPISLLLLDIYAQVISLLPRVALLGPHLRTRLDSLIIGQDIAREGASHALAISLPQRAVEILEQGRAVFWAHILCLRSPFEAVPDDLRAGLTFLARQLDRILDSPNDADESKATELEAARRRQQSEEFNSLLEKVRRLPGLERFLLPDQFTMLARSAERGPVVMLVSSALACHAIIIKPSGDILSLALKRITEDWLVEAETAWHSGVMEARSALRERLSLVKAGNRASSRRTRIANVLHRLWQDVVQPVLLALNIESATGKTRPRLWWCPTGRFSHLPVHAAGTEECWCSDYVVSSYIPTLGSLLAARRAYKPIKKNDVQALVTAVPSTLLSEWSDLHWTVEEVGAVRQALSARATIGLRQGGGKPDLLLNSDGLTTGRLLEELPQANILHLACHGYQNPENPLKSGFVMRDSMLTIEELMPVPLPNAFMAFLSACETAKGDGRQPDQTVHLAATMLFAGFKSVIATLWSMEDIDGPTIAKSVYSDIFSNDGEHLDPDEVAYALDEAIQKLRKDHPDPSRWAPYVHLGM
ncbi:hypothetical protein PUNSTDRAFT_74062 [Punctularia strigosozonata HHB-11173 SS5]|uniref:uncharacterized protein n=1 Tax=Punctularia strigosozonata (strain HHB-11173) TaxID=741275 RepID=UPI0004417DA5|nr:uncharacterized protein PUNSTDRAFT_74062 [Punctularia strigosozonata HHB-11173 SS5]EIN05926.1 hypothetical protein PUNSTDRAFT_74062 [Punctularia strigosozonata HHB-11173 SS5]